jgi:signal transduction histidine kinase
MIRRPAQSILPGGATLLVFLVALVLGLAGLVAYEAVAAARSRRVTAERALRDYATFASWELLARTSNRVQSTLRDALNPATGSRATSPYDRLPSLQTIEGSAAAVLSCDKEAERLFFRVDLRDGSLATSGRDPTAAERRWIADTVAQDLKSGLRPGQREGFIGAAPPDSSLVLAYGIKYAQYGAYAEPGAPIAVYGFLTCRDALGVGLIRRVFHEEPLLPQAVSGGLPSDSVLTLTVIDAAGRTLYASSDTTGDRFAHEVAMDPPAALRVRVGLRATAASRLEVPVAPSLRLPVLLALLILAAGLAAVGLLQLRREHELARLRTDFTSSVSHELRTPLAQILLYSETLMLERARGPDARREAAETIVQEARRLMRLVDNVLHFARAERGRPALETAPTLLAPKLRGILSSFLAAVAPGTLRVRTDLDEHATARLDSDAFTQIILNLLDNAVKYGPPGQTVSVALDQTDGAVRVLVDDEGPGVPPEDRSRIWEPFVRVSQRGAGSDGSGLGLAVVRELVEAHGGTARVDTSPRGGARFIVVLPAFSEAGAGVA